MRQGGRGDCTGGALITFEGRQGVSTRIAALLGTPHQL